MKINAVNEYRVEVELAETELRALGVSFQTLSWDSADTRRAVWSVLGALREQGVEVCLSGRLLIEAGPLPDGVRLCFTSLPQKNGKPPVWRLKRGAGNPPLGFDSLRDLRCAAALLPETALSAYRRGERYVLFAEHAPADAFARAAEYGVPLHTAGRIARAAAEEYFEPVEL